MGLYDTADYSGDDHYRAQSALDAAAADPRALVFFEPVEFELPQLLVGYGRTRIDTTGARLVGVDDNHRLFRSFQATDSFAGYEGPSDITVVGGEWDSAAPVGYDGPPANALGFAHGQRIEVRGATILNVAGAHAIEFNSIRGGRIIDCRARGFVDPGGRAFSEAFQLDGAYSSASLDIPVWDDTPCADIDIVGCYVGPSLDGVHGPFGALAGGHVFATGVYHQGIRVHRCTVDGSLSYGVRAYGWRDSSISHVHTRDVVGPAILVQHSVNTQVDACTLRDTGSNGVNVSASSDIRVSGNIIEGTADNYGIWVGTYDGQGATDVSVQGNFVRSAADAAIRLSTGADRCIVSGNTLRRGSGGATGVSCGAGAGTVNRVVANDLDGFTTNVSVSSGTVSQSW